jgi:hypothetical protein
MSAFDRRGDRHAAAAGLICRGKRAIEQQHTRALAGQQSRGGAPGRPRANDDRVVGVHISVQSPGRRRYHSAMLTELAPAEREALRATV